MSSLTPSLGQDTATNKGVTIPSKPAKEVVKDLKSGDAAKAKVDTLTSIIKSKDSIIAGKDTIISLRTQQVETSQRALDGYSELTKYLNDSLKKRDKQLKWSKFKTTVSQIALVITLGFLAFKL